jgi:alanyl-tRNA synthetase
LTKEAGFPQEKIWVSCFAGDKNAPRDEESARIWQALGIAKERISFLSKKDNWWGPVGQIGPCGPDSEMFVEVGTEKIEVWNNVFMEYEKKTRPEGDEFILLKQKNVDTGMGLERMTAIMEGCGEDDYQTELFWPTIQKIEKVLGKKYGDNKVPMRVIADHLRAAAFLVKDGVIPANKGQGYILRRLIRRALVKMRQLKTEVDEEGVMLVVDSVIKIYDGIYFDEEKDGRTVRGEVGNEVVKFNKALIKGSRELERAGEVDGRKAFDLYQSYGFPWELTVELAAERGQEVKREEFEKEFRKHQDLSRTAGVGMFRGGLQDQSETVMRYHTATHLLQAALVEVLGEQVQQMGSNITKSRARFDFSYGQKLTDEEIRRVEEIVNEKVRQNLPVRWETKDKEKAIKEGAKAFFPEKYPQQVKVYKIGNFSQEVCGGPHVDFTGKVGVVKIMKQEAMGVGKRRLYVRLVAAQNGSKKFS